jgi:hypothetical protein
VELTCKLGFDEPLQDLTMSSLHDDFLSMTHNSLPGQGMYCTNAQQVCKNNWSNFKVERIQTIQQQQPTPRSYPYGYLGALQHLPDVRYNFCVL